MEMISVIHLQAPVLFRTGREMAMGSTYALTEEDAG
jgi:hypothetical protein